MVLKRLLHFDQLFMGEQFLRQIEERGFVKTPATYGIMAQGYMACGELDKALGCLEDGVRKSATPGVGCWNSLLLAYARREETGKCKKLFKRTEALHGRGTASYRALVMCALAEGNVQEAGWLLEMAMRTSGTTEGTICTAIMNQILTYLCRRDRVEEALELRKQYQRKGIEADAFTHSILMDGYATRGDGYNANLLLEEMIHFGRKPDDACYRTVVKAWRKGGKLNRAAKFAKGMMRNGWQPDARVYVGMIESFLAEGGVHRAKEWLKRLKLAYGDAEGAMSIVVAEMEGKVREAESKGSGCK
ncbi:hypothetical protein HDV00_012217 [Rhizophlyctis rosea]|nr:hypothetical protein HDV00_012217 [Rhizophlyctis rosea]